LGKTEKIVFLRRNLRRGGVARSVRRLKVCEWAFSGTTEHRRRQKISSKI